VRESPRPALSEAFHLLEGHGAPTLIDLLRRQAVAVSFDLDGNLDAVLRFMEKYDDVPASLASACMVRMTETLVNPILLTTDTDFRIFRRHGRLTVPCVVPS
jgi:uncharacterized protein